MKKICIITQSHLCRNPRVLKEALTLSKAGFNVHIVTAVYSKSLIERDVLLTNGAQIQLHFISDLSKKNLRSWFDRLFSKAGKFLIRYFKIENSASLGYGSLRYFRYSKSILADLYICHQELATLTGVRLLEAGCRVAFDLEDWYSEDLMPEARRDRPIKLLRKMELLALKNGIYCTTTSKVLAEKIHEVYGGRSPDVLYNVFPSENDIVHKEKKLQQVIKLFWFSQTIGPGRGLETFFRVLCEIEKPLEIHLLGDIDSEFTSKLRQLISQQHLLVFHNLVAPEQLAEKIAEFDIGLALELPMPLSRNYTITNKFFQYLQSGLPVIASRTEGQLEAFAPFKPGLMLSENPNANEIDDLRNWLNEPQEWLASRYRAIEASKFYNWEVESAKLIRLVVKALE